jgi:3-hydroxybutyryl-CoA dehydrogenase
VDARDEAEDNTAINLLQESRMNVEAIRKICAVGAGAMGSTTALCFAMAGYEVRLYDITEEACAAGLKTIQGALESYKKHDLVREADILAIMARFHTTTDLTQAAGDADFIIESIVEKLDLKQKVFGELDKICPPHTTFATNTSGLSPTAIAEAIARKDKFVVTHFWNPAHLIPLVEVVPGAKTSPETVELAYQLIARIGKKPVRLSRESLGFVGNRIQAAALREALHIVATGIASAEDVDAVVRYSLGRRYAETGPLESADMGGLDIFRNIFSYLGPDLCNDPAIPEMLEKAVAEGRLGAKTGKGIYDWPADKLAAMKEARSDELFRHLALDVSRNAKSAKRVA